MKKIALILTVTVLVSLMYYQAKSCTNYLVTKGASADGSTMITYNADAGGFMEPLNFTPARDWDDVDSIPIYEWDTGKYLGKIKQAEHTYSVVGNMNEWQVSIGETTFGGRKKCKDSTGIMDYGSLMYIALQRAKTAREAIKVMTDLVAEYGYYSSGESFSIADPNEVWIMEMLGMGGHKKGAVWVARKIPDGHIAAHANQARIRKVLKDDKENCIYTEDIYWFAKKMGWYKPDSAEFSFADIYAPLDPGALMYCENRVWRFYSLAAPSLNLSPDYWRAVKGAEPYPLYIKPDEKLSVQRVIDLMRDHFEGTKWDMTKGRAADPFGCPYRWKNLSWEIEGDSTQYGWMRPVTTQQTGFTFVAQMRSWLPREIGGVFWYGVDDNYSNVYLPLYCCMTRPPESYITGSIQDFSLESAFWVFNLVSNLAYRKYSFIIKDIQEVQKEYEDKFFAFQPAIEEAAQSLMKKDSALAVKFLTDYSVNQAEMTVERWRKLWKHLVMKYNDGYVNEYQKGNGRNAKGVFYGDEFYRKVVKDRPDFYRIEWRDKSE